MHNLASKLKATELLLDKFTAAEERHHDADSARK
jgi:hypothetical protein